MAPTQLLYRPLPNPLDELDTVLAKTANMNRIVIISLECGLGRAKYHDSLIVGEGTQELLTFFFIIAMDAKAYNRCLQIHSYRYSMKTRCVDFSTEELFMSEVYLKIMWNTRYYPLSSLRIR